MLGGGAAHAGASTEPEPCHPATLPPRLPFSSPPLPVARAFQEGQVVREHLGDPEGEEK